MKTRPDDENGKEDATTSQIAFGVPENLKRTFKTRCVQQGRTMSEVLVEAIQRYVGEEL